MRFNLFPLIVQIVDPTLPLVQFNPNLRRFYARSWHIIEVRPPVGHGESYRTITRAAAHRPYVSPHRPETIPQGLKGRLFSRLDGGLEARHRLGPSARYIILNAEACAHVNWRARSVTLQAGRRPYQYYLRRERNLLALP